LALLFGVLAFVATFAVRNALAWPAWGVQPLSSFAHHDRAAVREAAAAVSQRLAASPYLLGAPWSARLESGARIDTVTFSLWDPRETTLLRRFGAIPPAVSGVATYAVATRQLVNVGVGVQ
jgi:hypothetical protein